MRPAHRLDLDPDPTPALDRAWAATRPEPPAPEVLDALWAAASRELDRVAAAPVSLPRARRWRPAGLILAQAAALLLSAGLFVARRPAAPVEVAAVPPTPTPSTPAPTPATPPAPAAAKVVVGFDETAVVRVDDDGPRVDRIAEAPGFPALVDATQHEVFNALESMVANP